MLGFKKINKYTQYFVSILLIVTTTAICFSIVSIIGYRAVALILLVALSVLAMLFDIVPVLVAAILSALIWNYFFIPPIFTFHITNTEDLLLFSMYFIIALVNAVLTFKIREKEKLTREKEEKENTIKLYNTLLNSLSHELKTPISTIIGAIDTLKENSNNLSEENKSELLSEMEHASMRLNRQVENLLNMSRLESGMLQIKKDWCDINELIFHVIHQFSSVDTKHTIEFIPKDHLPLFKLDAILIGQAIYNLLHNAILYTPENTLITISANYQSKVCVITISDNGKGFPENEINLAFDKFYRLPHTQAGGTGLGLSIVKGFIEAHNGHITLQNSETGGALFSIEIPTETSFINYLKNE